MLFCNPSPFSLCFGGYKSNKIAMLHNHRVDFSKILEKKILVVKIDEQKLNEPSRN